MSNGEHAKGHAQQKTLTGSSPNSRLLQRTCACGGLPSIDGLCTECRDKQLTSHSSRRGFEAPSASAVTQGNSSAQESLPSLDSAFDRASRFGHDFSRIPLYPTDRAPSLLPEHLDHSFSNIHIHRDSPILSVPNVQTKAEVGREGGPLSDETAKRINASRSNGETHEIAS